MPVPPLGEKYTGIACIWANAGEAPAKVSPSNVTTCKRVIVRLLFERALVDPDGAEGDAFDVTQSHAHPRIENFAQAEITTETEREVGTRPPATRGNEEHRLSVRHDADVGVFGIDATPERKAAGDNGG